MINGINLGGWLVLEYWMNRDLFKGLPDDCHDETCFMKHHEDAFSILDKHHDSWIKIEDLLWIKEQGFNLVRIPFPWWIFGEGGYTRSIHHLDRITTQCEEIGLDFMLDLHTAPGCQNGFDNGGIEGTLTWHTKQAYINKTIEVLIKVFKRYNELQHFHSIELLNEPFATIPLNIIQDFYKESYTALRELNSSRFIIFHDAFRFNQWESFFKENQFKNVILDTHMYQCFDHSMFDKDINGHVQLALNRQAVLDQVQLYVPVIVGEWSLGLRMNKELSQNAEKGNLSQYYEAQKKGMSTSYGTIFWSYKIFGDTHLGWNMKRLIKEQVIK
jgi:glucan 1,3-beta-glucosidase